MAGHGDTDYLKKNGMNSLRTYKGWSMYESLPEGWKMDNTAGSPLSGYGFCNNGKSILNGGKRALVKVHRSEHHHQKYPDVQHPETKDTRPLTKDDRRLMNEVARSKLKETLLKDITVDLMICKIEGWDYRKYVAELHALIDGVHESIHPKQSKLF
jgi:hypothetical protein